MCLLLWPPLYFGLSHTHIHTHKHKGSFKGIAFGIWAMPYATTLCYAGWAPSFALCHSSIQFVFTLLPPAFKSPFMYAICSWLTCCLLLFTKSCCNACSLRLSSSAIPIELSLLLMPLNFFPQAAAALRIVQGKRVWQKWKKCIALIKR